MGENWNNHRSSNISNQSQDISEKTESYANNEEIKVELMNYPKATQENVDYYTSECFKCIEKDDFKNLERLLEEMKSLVHISELKNEEGFTLLHQCAFKDKSKTFFKIIKFSNNQFVNGLQIKDWVNKQTTKDKFTALHYASYRGNVDMMKILVDLGADIYLQNMFGLNVLHIAA